MALKALRFNEYVSDGEYHCVREGDTYPTDVDEPKRSWLIDNEWAVETGAAAKTSKPEQATKATKKTTKRQKKK